MTYYTPKIEEFHVGFEYEIRTHKEDDKWIWESKVFKCRDFYDISEAYDRKLEHDEFRIKHLDREDIESFGWEFEIEEFITGIQDLFINKKGLMMLYNHKAKLISIYNEQGDLVNNMVIKNKSELKRLMKQLNIEHDS